MVNILNLCKIKSPDLIEVITKQHQAYYINVHLHQDSITNFNEKNV